jgi:hypothetical protein
MKKIALSVIALGISLGSIAQDAADKKVQAGLIAGVGLNFQKMGTSYLETNGLGNDLTIGSNVNFSLTETIAFSTGAEFDFSTVKYKAGGYLNTDLFYYYSDKELLETGAFDQTNSQHELFQMETRKQKAVYLTIPTMMVFRTNFIGYFRYFGKFGLRNSFLLSSKINDTGNSFDPETPLGTATSAENIDMKATGDMFFFKSAVGLSAGAEWNFSGSTCLVAEVGYYYGFTPLHTNRNIEKGKNYLFASDINNGGTSSFDINNDATQSQLMLKVSILF